MAYRYISNEPVANKTLIVRIDLNSNYQNNKLVVGERLIGHSRMLRRLSDQKAKLIVLGHQGQRGKPDYFPLSDHAVALEKLIGKPVRFVSWKSDYIAECKGLAPGEIILMDNVREFDDEFAEVSATEHSTVTYVRSLAQIADAYVLDALSVSHRSHASVVGFSTLLPCFAGPSLEKELRSLAKTDQVTKNRLFVLGGAKPKDTLELISYSLDHGKADKILVGGLPAEILLKAKGYSLGKKDFFLKEKGFFELLPMAKELLQKNPGQIILPVGVAVSDLHKKRVTVSLKQLPTSFPIMDIGDKTIALFSSHIKAARLIVCNGTMGVFEQKGFEKGSKKIFSAISRNKKAFSLIGGGDTVTALHQFKLDFGKFGHVSLAGKALLEYLCGETLPGLQALSDNAEKNLPFPNRSTAEAPQ